MDQFLLAPRYLQRALALARQRQLLPWIAIPLTLNVLLFGALYYLLGSALIGLVASLTAGWELPENLSFLQSTLEAGIWVVMAIVWLALLILLASVFTMVAQLILAPFMGFLAEKVDLKFSHLPMPDESLLQMIKRTFRRELTKIWDWLWRSLLVGIVVLALLLIPGLNIVGSALWFLWSAWSLAIQYADYGADNRHYSYPELKRRVRQKPMLMLGFGVFVLCLTMLPLVNLVILPLAVIAGTLIWVEQLAPELSIRSASSAARPTLPQSVVRG